MGELFAHPRLRDVLMDRVPLEEPEASRFGLRTGDLLFARQSLVLAGAGKCSIFLGDPEPVTFESHVIRVRLDPTIADPLYYYYFFLSRTGRSVLESIVEQGAGASGIRASDLARLLVPRPAPDEQRRIAGILGALDDRIELNRRLSETLEETSRALFRSWFVDFEDGPRNADAWPHGTLLDLATLTPESVSARELPETVQYVDLAGAKNGRIDTITAYARSAAPSRAQRVLRPGDTIVGTVRPGNRSFAFVPRDGLIGSTGFAHLRPVNPRDAGFVYLTATADANIDRLAHLADGAAYPAVRPGVVGATQTVLPDPGTLERFSFVATPLLARATQAGAESETLIALRDMLLPRLLSGELRPDEAARLAAPLGRP